MTFISAFCLSKTRNYSLPATASISNHYLPAQDIYIFYCYATIIEKKIYRVQAIIQDTKNTK